ncbi:MAG: peptidoglycan DD-metalloendopeptidase family protein [Paludibacteraceae bacterium]|nr:peptidoglycan DD-metalloendopeptidase family protein [Paludibacteraceae bacterium]
MADTKHKYRLAMLDDITLREVFHFRVSLLGAVSVITITLISLIVLLSVLIVYTPLRNILPGYSASLRQQLIQESARVDSLQTSLTVQRQYLDVIKQLTAGDIATETVQSLDSLERVERAQIAEQRNEVTEAFMAQYEQKERDRLMLFDNTETRSMRQLYRPVRGVIVQSARPDYHQYGVTIRTTKNENVMAATRGTIVSVDHLADNTYAVVLQNGAFTTIYRHVAKMLKMQGTQVESGESIGLVDGEHDVVVELWDAGKFINPEEVIVW